MSRHTGRIRQASRGGSLRHQNKIPRPDLFQHGFDKIVFPHRDAAGQYQDIFFQSALDLQRASLRRGPRHCPAPRARRRPAGPAPPARRCCCCESGTGRAVRRRERFRPRSKEWRRAAWLRSAAPSRRLGRPAPTPRSRGACPASGSSGRTSLRCRAARCFGPGCAARSKRTWSPLTLRVLDHHHGVCARTAPRLPS